MNDYYPLLLALGTLAVSSGLVILITDVISIILYQNPSTSKAEVLALVSSTFHGTTLVLMALLVYQYYKNHKSQQPESLESKRYLIVFAGASCIASSGVTALELALDKTKKGNTVLEPKTLRPPESLVLGAVISGAASIISQCAFVICLACLHRRKRISKSFLSNTSDQSTQISTSIYTQPSILSTNTRQKYLRNFKSTDLKLSSLKRHSLKIVEKFSSTRSSHFSQKNSKVIPEKDCLSSCQFTRSHTPNLLLIDRNNKYPDVDKTSIDINPSQSVESLAIPPTIKPSNSFKFLETIPASPTDPSGGEDFRSMLPQNPQPIARRNGSTRSYSPANSYREPKRYSRSPTPVEINRESHIHPLFRTDSSDPPPAVTPGTIVTAAPGAGKVISNRASLRSLRSKKSGSSLHSRRKDVSNSENVARFTENESRSMPQLQEPLPTYGVNFEASN